MSEHTPERDGKLEAGSLVDSSPTLRKLDNFWYYYKWPVIVTTFFVAVIIICAVQIISRPAYDTTLAVGSTYSMTPEERVAFEDLLERVCPDDFNDDGEVLISLVTYRIYSEEEYLAEAESYEAESDQFFINRQYNSEEYKNFNTYTMTGETSVYILSPYLYQTLRDGDRLKSLAELYPDGTRPAGAREDGYGVTLGETDFYRYNPAAQVLPADLILCIHRPTVSGNSSHEDAYADEIAFFRAIADYDVIE